MKPVPRQSTILTLLFIGVLMGALDISIVGPAIPSIELTMDIGERELSWIYSIYILFNLVGISLMARLSDVFGRKHIYILAVAIFGLGSAVVAMSTNITWLLAGRAIQGFGSSGIFPVAIALVGDLFPVEKRGRALGMIGAVFGIAFLLGPFIAGFILMYFTWNVLFLINLPVAVGLIFAAARILPGKVSSAEGYIDWPGIGLMAISLTCFTLSVNNLDMDRLPESLFDPLVMALFGVSVLMVPLLIYVESRQKAPVLNVALFRSKQVRLVGFFAVGLGMFQSTIVFMPAFSVQLYGVSPSTASFMLLPVVAGTAIGSPVFGRLVDRFGSRAIILTGMVISSVALFLLGLALRNLTVFYSAMAMLGLGMSIRSSLSYIMLNEVPAAERASTQGILLIFISVGQLSGAALTGAITASNQHNPEGFGLAFSFMGLLALLLSFPALLLKSRKSELIKQF